ncbi:MAG TPA: hypothetical protein VGO93_26800 [Candidatus Xenobia bacterium]
MIIERLATALDRDDYATAASCLQPDCRYEVAAGTVLGGPTSIVDSFRSSSTWAHAHLERVLFEHRRTGPGRCLACHGGRAQSEVNPLITIVTKI